MWIWIFNTSYDRDYSTSCNGFATLCEAQANFMEDYEQDLNEWKTMSYDANNYYLRDECGDAKFVVFKEFKLNEEV